ncbi:MAG: thermonuclease family protein [Acidimicrobiaceae bacterium]
MPFAFILLIGLCSACTGANSVQSDVATIESVIDGDTIVLRVQNQTETVRLLGVDTPETVHPSKPIECYGPEASAFTKATLAKGSTVKLLRDVEPRDRFQRLLVYLFLADGTLFNQLLIDRGFARTLSIEPNTAFASQFATHESNAKDRRVGLWQSCER